MNDLSVNTMLGQFGLQKIDVQVDANGVVENGALREKLTISGLKMPDGVVPPWAASLVPQTFTIDFNIADFNLDTGKAHDRQFRSRQGNRPCRRKSSSSCSRRCCRKAQ